MNNTFLPSALKFVSKFKYAFVLFLMIFVGFVNKAVGQEAYAVVSTDSTTLTFYFDNQKANREGTVYELNSGNNTPGWLEPGFRSLYTEPHSKYTKVIFDASFASMRPTSCYSWFAGFDKITSIIGLEYLNTSYVTNMSYMFYNCRSLTSLDVSNFITNKVTTMASMFHHCQSLEYINVSSFNTDKVTDMNSMFDCCKKLRSIDLRRFNTVNVTRMGCMFYECKSLTILDLSSFDTRHVNNTKRNDDYFNFDDYRGMRKMFYSCANLTTIYASDKFVLSYFETIMFSGCTKLVGEKGSNYNNRQQDYKYAHIDEGPSNPGLFQLLLLLLIPPTLISLSPSILLSFPTMALQENL